LYPSYNIPPSQYIYLVYSFSLMGRNGEVEHASACFVNLIDNLTS
jgi:hypothetical protein